MKKILWAALFVLAVAVGSMIGGSFAWFNDLVQSEQNHISTGTLDVVMEYKRSTDDENWIPIAEESQLLGEEGQMEPGFVDVVYYRVRNAGSLALQYRLGFSVEEENPAIGALGEFYLSDYLFGGIVALAEENGEDGVFRPAETSLEEAVQGFGRADYAAAATCRARELQPEDVFVLLPGEEICGYMVIHVPESVRNEANYTGNLMPQLALGVELRATQWTGEEDAFGFDYDAGAEYPTPTPEPTAEPDPAPAP